MSDSLILIDTDILIDVSRGINQAVQKLDELDLSYQLSVSIVTQLELMVGCSNKKELKELKRFLKKFEVIHISEAISINALELFEKYRLSHGVLIADMLIASTAITYKIELISKNQKDYKFIDDLDLIEYLSR